MRATEYYTVFVPEEIGVNWERDITKARAMRDGTNVLPTNQSTKSKCCAKQLVMIDD